MVSKYETEDSSLTDVDTEDELQPVAKWAKIQGKYADPDISTKHARGKAVNQLRDEFVLLLEEETETLYRYDDSTGIYRDDAERKIRERLARTLEQYYTTREQRQIFHWLKSLNAVPVDDFWGPPETICVANGVLDISDPQEPLLKDHDPDFQFRRRLPVEYDPDAECPQFEQFLNEVVYDADREKLQEFVGYCLHHWGMPFNRALMLTGPEQSGKSTFLEVVTELLGPDNVAHESLQRLAGQRFAPAQLYGKFANIRADLDSSVVKHIGLFKELAAGDPITVERKHEDPFRLNVTQKQLYAANQVPDLSEEDDAFHERWIHVQFPKTVPKDDRDQFLDERLTTEDELAGILNWALEGYVRLREQGRFTGERSLEGKRDLWRSQGDTIDQFVAAKLETDSNAETPKEDVYDAYRDFCDDLNRRPEAKQTLTKRLEREHNVGQSRPQKNGKRVRCYSGVAIDDGQLSDEELEIEHIEIGEGV